MAPDARAFHPFGSKELEAKVLVDAAEVYDSNITFTPSEEIDDLITELTGGLEVDYEARKHRLSVLGQVRQQIFAENSSFNNNAQFGDVDYRYDLTERDRIKFTDKFSHAEEPRSFDEQLGGDNGRFSRVQNSSMLEYSRDISKKLSLAGRYGNGFTLLSRSDLRDSVQNRVGIDGNYFLSSATMVSLFYQFLHRHFSGGSNTGAENNANNAAIHEFAAGIRRYFTRQLFGDMRGGLGIVDDFGRQTLLKPIFSASLNNDVDERTQLKLLGFEWRTTTSSFENSVFNSWRLSAGIKHDLTKKLSGELGGFFGMGEYETTEEEETLFGAAIQLIYEVSDNWQVSGGYTLTIRDSTPSTQDYTKNLAFVKLSVGY